RHNYGICCHECAVAALGESISILKPHAIPACAVRVNVELSEPAAWFTLCASREQGSALVALAETPRGLRRDPSQRLLRRFRARHSPRRKGTRRIGLPDEGAGLAAELCLPRQVAGAWPEDLALG